MSNTGTLTTDLMPPKSTAPYRTTYPIPVLQSEKCTAKADETDSKEQCKHHFLQGMTEVVFLWCVSKVCTWGTEVEVTKLIWIVYGKVKFSTPPVLSLWKLGMAQTSITKAMSCSSVSSSKVSKKSVLTVRRGGVEWVMGWGHISGDDHEKDGVAWQTLHHPPSRRSQSRLHSAQNTCAVTDWCGSRSVYTDHQEREKRVKDKV